MENTQNLIGRKFKGFKFEQYKELTYASVMNSYINKELVIDGFIDYAVDASNGFMYPLEEVLKHLIPEEEEIQIPELPEGVLMLVSFDNDYWFKAYVIGKDKEGNFYLPLNSKGKTQSGTKDSMIAVFDNSIKN